MLAHPDVGGSKLRLRSTVYSDFENYAGGIYHHVTGSMAGGHAVKFVGWGVEGGVKYWKVRATCADTRHTTTRSHTLYARPPANHYLPTQHLLLTRDSHFSQVANSWNPYWGEKGYFRIKRGTNEGGIEDQVIGTSATAKWAKKSELH